MLSNNWTEEDIANITTFLDGDPNENPWVHGKPQIEKITIKPHSAAWHERFLSEKRHIQFALGQKAILIEHVGSTAVPNLAAKPVIDIDLIVADPSDESSYVPALEELGYCLNVREPSWYQHRMLRLENPRVNLHVFAPNCAEHIRHVLFRDWLCHHEDDRKNYEQSKLDAQQGVNNADDYNKKKHAVMQSIYEKIFSALKNNSPNQSLFL